MFEVELLGRPGKRYLFETSSDLKNWVALGTNVAPSGPLKLVDPAASRLNRRFYRARELPRNVDVEERRGHCGTLSLR